MRLNRMTLAAGLASIAFLAGCAGEPVVADISQDKVIVQANGANGGLVYEKAEQSCALYKKHATPMSQRCGDQYCIQKYYLFACVPN